MKKITSLFLALTVGLTFAASAKKDKDKDDGESKPDRIQVTVTIPDTADQLWEQIDAQRKALGDAIDAKNKDNVYRIAETLEKLTKAIPEKYPNLVGLQKKSVHHQAKSASRLCNDLHDAMVEDKVDQVTQILGQIDGALKFAKTEATKK